MGKLATAVERNVLPNGSYPCDHTGWAAFMVRPLSIRSGDVSPTQAWYPGRLIRATAALIASRRRGRSYFPSEAALGYTGVHAKLEDRYERRRPPFKG